MVIATKTTVAPAATARTGTTAIVSTATAAVMAAIETDPEIATQLVSQMGRGATAVSAGEEMEADLGLARARMLTQMKSRQLGTPPTGATRATDTVEVVAATVETAAAISTAVAVEVGVRDLPTVTEATVARTDTATVPLATALAVSVIRTIVVAAADAAH